MLTVDYKLLGMKDGERVLDVGCGEGRHSYEASKRYGCSICALDIEEANLDASDFLGDGEWRSYGELAARQLVAP